MKPQDRLDAIFDADRALREAEAALLALPSATLSPLLAQAVQIARSLPDRAEAEACLRRLADLCAQVEGDATVDALLQILDDQSPAVRVEACEALVDRAYDRYAEVARAIERALSAGAEGPSMAELPWVLVEVAEPSAVGLVGRFLTHPRAEVVGSAIEALAQLGDPAAVPALRGLVRDPREVTVDDEDEGLATTVGELAREAIEALQACNARRTSPVKA